MTSKTIKPISVPSIEVLETAHQFPTLYTIKVIGPDTSDFRTSARATCLKHLDQDSKIDISERQSKTGQHLALTLKFQAPSASKVQDIYRELTNLEGLKFII